MSISNKLHHALHNEEVCDFLIKNSNYNDWIVTTAFYSALHFVQYKMFPMLVTHPYNGSQITINSFDDYYILFSRIIKKNKHEVTATLVNEKIPAIKTDYRRLKDMCMSARYNNYVINAAFANACRNRLRNIKGACLPSVDATSFVDTNTTTSNTPK